MVVSVDTYDSNSAVINQLATNSSYIFPVSGCPNSCPNDDKCVTSSCSTKSGVTGCHSTAIAYDDSNACTVDACDSTTGISHTTRVCPSSDLCTLGLCDTTTGCYTEPVDCTGNTTCSNYHCDTTTGSCVADANSCCGSDSTHCTTTSKCNITSCVMSGGEPTCAGTTLSSSSDLKSATCKHVLIDCSDYNFTEGSGSEWTCKQYTCTENGTDLCFVETIVSDSSNPCDKCRNTTSTTRCIGGLTVAAASAIIGAAAIAGIVVACVVGFLIFSAVSAFGTYKLVQMSRAGANMGAHNNPMYKPSDSEAVNPAYST
eukprot:m51a1_g13240 hypothetical protein (315) ;mRNA; f:725-2222